eukprot:COSAG03_NODE_16059_length_412_cov_113.450479_1_plen_42_part_10
MSRKCHESVKKVRSLAPLQGRCSDAVAGFEQTQRCLPVYMVH